MRVGMFMCINTHKYKEVHMDGVGIRISTSALKCSSFQKYICLQREVCRVQIYNYK